MLTLKRFHTGYKVRLGQGRWLSWSSACCSSVENLSLDFQNPGWAWLWEGIGDFLGASRPASLAYRSSQQDTYVKVEDDNQHLWVVLWPPHVYSHKYAGTHICTKIFFLKKAKLDSYYFKYEIKVVKDVNIYIQCKG